MNKILLSLFFLFASFRCYPNIDILNGVWMVSSMVTGSVVWSERFLEVENLAKDNKWDAASKLAKKYQNLPDSTNGFLVNGEPYSLVLDGLNIAYRVKAGERQSAVKTISRAFMDRNYPLSKGRIFYSYKYISQRYRKACLNNNKEYFAACKEIINYDPYDKAQIIHLVSWVAEHQECAGKLLDFIQELQSRGVILSPEIYLNLIKTTTLPNKDRANKLIRWIELNKSTRDNYLLDAIDELISATDDADNETLDRAYKCLLNLALRQGPDSSRTIVTAKAMKASRIIEERAGKAGIDIKKCGDKEAYNTLYSKVSELTGDNINWNALRENLSYLWGLEHNQRFDNTISLSDLIDSLDLIEELKIRLSDNEDRLTDIDKYSKLHLIPGVSGQLYWLAEKLYWKGEYEKCFNALKFFLLPENKDGFTIGATHFYLGRMLKQLPSRRLNNLPREDALKQSLEHLLVVHTYPTCLTYISYSYIMAAEDLNDLDHPEQALALCMVDVPSIDYAYVKTRRHENAANYCLTLGDKVSCLKHLQEMVKYAGHKKDDEVGRYFEKLGFSQKVWDDFATNFFSLADKHLAIEKAMSTDCPVDSELLLSALTHSWPSLDDIPLAMATNRVLNNNVNLTKK